MSMAIDLKMQSNDSTLDADFESLRENKDWESIHAIYMSNIQEFSKVIDKIMITFEVSKIEARDIILYELMSSTYGRKHRSFLHSQKRFRWSMIYVATLIGIFLNGLISIFRFQKKVKTDLLYEEMFAKAGWNTRFYKYITELIKDKPISKAIFYIHPGFNKDFFNTTIAEWQGEVINRRSSCFFFPFKEAISLVFHNLTYISSLYKFSHKINVTYLYLRVIRKYLLYSSQTKNLEANIIVAAGDYYWNPMKYLVYKKHIKHIILLQHNYKNESLHNRFLQYCDIYFAHSKQAIEKLDGIPFAQKQAIGSFQVIPYLEPVATEYDIVFINQTVNQDIRNFFPYFNQEKLIENYYLLIENFKRYLQKNQNLNVIYIAKGDTIEEEPSLSVKKIFSDFKNIEFEGTYGPRTFEVIKKSRLIINMYSSVGFEAYGFDKRVLWINYNGCCDVFKYDMDEESLHILKDSTDYITFEGRVDLLLSSNEKVDEHYKKLKEKYMNIQENPAKIVANKIEELILEKK